MSEINIIVDSESIKSSRISKLELILPPQRPAEATMYELRLHLSRKKGQIPIRYLGGLGGPTFDLYIIDYIQQKIGLRTSKRTEIVRNPNLSNFEEFVDDLERIKENCIKY
ncbi:MAG: hypothetical protein V1663_03175 [archaeon]